MYRPKQFEIADDAEMLDLIRANGFADHGTARSYLQLIDYVERHDLSQDAHYAHVQTLMDVENFAEYWIFQMFISNADNGNIRFWREDTPEGRWRWLLYDLDWAWRYVEPDTVAFSTNPQGTGANKAFRTILIRQLLTNDDFRDLFLRLCGEHLRETFAPERTLPMIDTLAKEIEQEAAARRDPKTKSRSGHQNDHFEGNLACRALAACGVAAQGRRWVSRQPTGLYHTHA